MTQDAQPDENGWYNISRTLPPVNMLIEFWYTSNTNACRVGKWAGKPEDFPTTNWYGDKFMGWVYLIPLDVCCKLSDFSHWRHIAPPIL